MPLFVMVPFAAALSLGAGIAVVYVATHWLPPFDEPASIGMGEVFGILGSILYAAVTMLVMGVTLWRARSERAIWIAMLVLLAPIGAILLIGLTQSGVRINLAREVQGLLQFIVPLCLTVMVQWFLLRRYLRQRR
jgi:uncharacterized membrane protein YesL